MGFEDIGHWPVCRCDVCGYTTWGDVPVMGQEHRICGGTFQPYDEPYDVPANANPEDPR